MKRKRAAVMFLVAIALGLLAASVANSWIRERLNPTAEASGDPVVVAAVEIPFGRTIEFGDLRTVSFPADSVPPGAFRNTEAVVGRVATQKVLPGEVLLQERIVRHGAGSALAAVLAPNKRAVTVRVNDVVGVGGFLLPGNRVDVLASRRNKDRKVETRILLENLKVLAVDQTASADESKPVIVRAVTLETTPEQAETLVRATEEGSVQMALRNPLAPQTQAPKVVAKKDPPPKPRPRVRPRTATVTVIRGTDVERVRVHD